MHSLPPGQLPDLGDILPYGAATAAAVLRMDDFEHLDELYPGIPLPIDLAAAVPARRLQYAAGRHCVRAALSRLGTDLRGPIGRDPQRVPVWPVGLTGSIAHTDDLAWAAAIPTALTAGLGIDVERIAAAGGAGIDRLVCGPDEHRAGDAAGLACPVFLTLAFSVKESLFKSLFPIVRRFFDFRDAALTRVDPATGHIEVRLESSLDPGFPAGMTFTGRFARSATHVFTSIHVPCGGGAGRAATLAAGHKRRVTA